MSFSLLLDRFTEHTPLTVMTRGLLENTLQPEPLNDLFRRLAQQQYERHLLFSSVVDVMVLVACRIFKSPRAVHLEYPDHFPVSLKCFYEKLQGIELPVMRELVCDNARRLQPIIEHLHGQLPPLLDGFRVKILDGNCLAATHHRLKELRSSQSAPLPGKSLVVLDPALGLIVDVIPCENGHAQERSLIPDVVATVKPGDLWIADRNFCTLGLIMGVKERQGAVLVREHKNLPWEPKGELTLVGTIETGTVYKQRVQIKEGKKHLSLRRIVIQLNEPTRDNETEVVLLTNVRKVSALKLARLYRDRWGIENAFNVLTTTLKCEVNSLGYPKAALFAFCVTLVAYNVLATVKAALASVHGVEKVGREVSVIKLTEHVSRNYEGMGAGMGAEEWVEMKEKGAKEMAEWLREVAKRVCLKKLRKAPTKPRKNNEKRAKRPYDPKQPHIATAEVLAARRTKKPTKATARLS